MTGHYGPEEWWYPDGTSAANVRAVVFEGDQSTLASIFSDLALTVPLPNPTTTDGSGLLEFYVADGDYWIFVGDENYGDSVLATLGPPVTGTGGALLISNNLSDLSNVVTARSNLGLGNSATRNVGTVAGTVAAGDDSRFTTVTYQGITVNTGEALSTALSTGVIYGGVMTVNADPSKVDITAILGYIVDYETDPTNPTLIRIQLPAQIGVSMDAGSLARLTTYWMIDDTGTLIQSGTSPTRADRRSNLIIGFTAQNAGAIFAIASVSDHTPQLMPQFMDLARSLGAFLVNGCTLSPNVGLTFERASGAVFALDGNQNVNPADPHVVSVVANDPVSFRYATRASVILGPLSTTVDPSHYDVADVVTPIPGSNNQATIQRVFYFPISNNTAIQYGQNLYNTLDAAIAAIPTAAFVANPLLTDENSQGILLGAIVLTKGCTNLSDTTTARIFTFPKFSTSVSGGGASTGDVAGPGSSTDNALVRFDGITGKLIQDSNTTLTDGGSLILTGQTPTTHVNGQLYYDTSQRTVCFDNDEPDVRIDLGKELFVEARNDTGSTITKGQAVYINGTHGTGVPTIALAKADAFVTALVAGLAAHDIEVNTNGFVTLYGDISDIDTSAFAGGNALYVSPTTAGALTATRPVAPNFVTRVGIVTKANPSGRISVSPQARQLGFGTANQLLGMNAAGVGGEFKTLNGTANRLTVVHAANSVTLDVSNTLMDTKTDKATLTTKGDLYAATAASTPARQAVGTDGQYLRANSATSTGLEWGPGSLSFALRPRAGVYSQAGAVNVVRSSKAVTLNAMYLRPFVLSAVDALTAIAFELTSSTATAVARLGIYSSSASDLPDTRLVDFGTFTADTIGLRNVTGLNQALSANTLYWVAIVFQTAAPNVRHAAGWNPWVSSTAFPTGAGAGWNDSYVQTGVAGALPATIGAISDTDSPAIGLAF